MAEPWVLGPLGYRLGAFPPPLGMWNVRFRDCDPMGHANNAVYLTYLEQARFAHWRDIWGFDLERLPEGTPGVILVQASRPDGSGGTSTAYSRRISIGINSRARSWVDASTIGAAAPSSWARSQLMAVTHQRSPGTRPGNRYSGIGLLRSLPMPR